MASLAGMLQARGHRVTGSDENVYPPMSTMLEALGINVMLGYGPEHLRPAPDCVVIEGAEYDTAYFDKGPKFMHYLPETAIVGNIEFDHADIYKDLDSVKLAFRRLLNLVPSNGRLVAGWDSTAVRETVAEMGDKLHTRLETFGTCTDARWQARDVDYTSGELTRFRVLREGEEWGE